MIIWLFAASITLGILIRFIYMNRYWPKRKILVLPSKFLSAMAVRDATFAKIATKNYQDMKKSGAKYSGIFSIFQPVLVVTDLDLIREILTDPLIRDHFLDKGYHYSCDIDLSLGECVELDGKNWEDMCQKLTPDFSWKYMKPLRDAILTASNFMSQALLRYATDKRDIDVREFLDCFTTDLIGLDCFKINCDSFKTSDIRSQQWPIVGGLLRNLRFRAIYNYPNVSSTLGFKTTEQELAPYIHDRIRHSLESHRQCREDGSYYTDLLLYLHKYHQEIQGLPDMSHILSKILNLSLFFSQSFDNVCSTLYFAIYELCRDLDIQEKARREIKDILKKHGDKISSESLNDMRYLQLIICETLRKYPPTANYLRVCIENYKLKQEDLTIKKKTRIFVPLFAIHRDEQYYPQPDKFDPERFNPENKEVKHPFIFMPFGEGPRYASSILISLLQCKIGLVTILSKCRLHMSPKTKFPFREDAEIFMKSVERLYIRAEPLKGD